MCSCATNPTSILGNNYESLASAGLDEVTNHLGALILARNQIRFILCSNALSVTIYVHLDLKKGIRLLVLISLDQIMRIAPPIVAIISQGAK